MRLFKLCCRCNSSLFKLIVSFPIEFFLVLLIIASLINSLIHCPIFWQPAEFVALENLENDISLCSSRETTNHGLPSKCPLLCKDESVVPMLRVDEKFMESFVVNNDIKPGGSYSPSTCVPVHKVIVIVPFRSRNSQLKLFLQNMHPFLVRQSINYTIAVVEQVDEYAFNRGKLFNVGFIEMMKVNHDACCFIFHDVDLLPESSQNMYTCSKNPRHMSPFVNTLRYSLIYKDLFGGAIAMKRDQFKTVNGFSNMFYGWGGEDDDISRRLKKFGLKITRWPYSISRYYMLSHVKEIPGSNKDILLDTSAIRPNDDGLSSIEYKVKSITDEPLFTRIRVYL